MYLGKAIPQEQQYQGSIYLHISPVSPRMGSGGPIGISLHTLIARAPPVRDTAAALRMLRTTPPRTRLNAEPSIILEHGVNEKASQYIREIDPAIILLLLL